jgi:uncharacterized protein YebE (UPF0316 family)
MTFLPSLPPLVLGVAIFCLRIVDVSIGTVRTISMVQGRSRIAVFLGFFEVLVWITVVAQVVTRIDTEPLLAPFYAGGYAAGIAVGMLIERRLSAGRYLVRIITHTKAAEIAAAIGDRGRVVGTFPGATPEGTATLVFVSALGRRVPEVLRAARGADPTLLYTVEMALGWSENVHPPQVPWRGQHQRK